MTAPELVHVLAGRLADADRAGSQAELFDALDDAAELLVRLYEHQPVALPLVMEAVALAPGVPPAALSSAAHIAAQAAAEVTVEVPAVLHPQCFLWVALACSAHPGADPRRVTAAATLHMSPDGIRRLGDLPMSDELRDLAGSCTSADLRAGIEVRHLHADALAEEAERMRRLLELVAPHMVGEGMTLAEAVDALDHPARGKAEALLDELPLVLVMPGGGRRP